MLKNKIAILAVALAVVAPLAGCGSSDSSSSTDTTGSAATTTTSESTEELDEVSSFFVGTWQGYVEVSEEGTYATSSGAENMEEVVISADGTVTVTPMNDHNVLEDSGTWEAADTDSITLHLSDGDITLTVTSSSTMEADAADFDIDDYFTLYFNLVG